MRFRGGRGNQERSWNHILLSASASASNLSSVRRSRSISGRVPAGCGYSFATSPRSPEAYSTAREPHAKRAGSPSPTPRGRALNAPSPPTRRCSPRVMGRPSAAEAPAARGPSGPHVVTTEERSPPPPAPGAAMATAWLHPSRWLAWARHARGADGRGAGRHGPRPETGAGGRLTPLPPCPRGRAAAGGVPPAGGGAAASSRRLQPVVGSLSKPRAAPRMPSPAARQARPWPMRAGEDRVPWNRGPSVSSKDRCHDTPGYWRQGGAAGMAVGAERAAGAPAMRGAIGIGTQMPRRIDGALAAPGAEADRRRGAGRLGPGIEAVLTSRPHRLVERAGKGLGGVGALTWGLCGVHRGRWGLVRRRAPGMDAPPDHHESRQQARRQHRGGWQDEALLHGEESGSVSRMRPPLNYPLWRGTPPAKWSSSIPSVPGSTG